MPAESGTIEKNGKTSVRKREKEEVNAAAVRREKKEGTISAKREERATRRSDKKGRRSGENRVRHRRRPAQGEMALRHQIGGEERTKVKERERECGGRARSEECEREAAPTIVRSSNERVKRWRWMPRMRREVMRKSAKSGEEECRRVSDGRAGGREGARVSDCTAPGAGRVKWSGGAR